MAMTEMLSHVDNDNFDEGVERLVDTQGISYFEARQELGSEPIPFADPADDINKYLSVGAAALIDKIGAAKFKSELEAYEIWPEVTNAAREGAVSPDEVDYIKSVIEARRKQLTGPSIAPAGPADVTPPQKTWSPSDVLGDNDETRELDARERQLPTGDR